MKTRQIKVGILVGKQRALCKQTGLNSPIVSDRGAQDELYDKCIGFVHSWISRYNQDQVDAANGIGKEGPKHCSDLVLQLHTSPAYTCVVPDEKAEIQRVIRSWTNNNGGSIANDEAAPDLILTSGGTGFTPRDTTPEAIGELLDQKTPGLTHLILAKSFEITPFAALTRLETGMIYHAKHLSPELGTATRRRSLLIMMPGKPKACLECLEIVQPVLMACLVQMLGINKPKHVSQSKKPDAVPAVMKGGCRCDEDDSKDESVAARDRQSKFPMLELDEALSVIRSTIDKKSTSRDCVMKDVYYIEDGDVVVEKITSNCDVPEFDCSFVDGYAFNWEQVASNLPDTGSDQILLRVKGISIADKDMNSALRELNVTSEASVAGDAVRIATGAQIPGEMDTVIMVEHTQVHQSVDAEERIISIPKKLFEEKRISKGDNIRPRASDIQKGQVIIPANSEVKAALGMLGLIRMSQARRILVLNPPRVAVMSSGNEVTDGLDGESGVLDMNRPNLLSLVDRLHCTGIDLGIVRDSENDLKSAIHRAFDQGASVLICSGGVSMGEKDYFKQALQSCGARIHFGRLNLKPGKPTVFATLDKDNRRLWIFGLPGNPVSAITTFHLVVEPTLTVLHTSTNDGEILDSIFRIKPILKARPIQPIRRDSSRPEFHRVRLIFDGDAGWKVESTGSQVSSRLLSYQQCDALILVPPACVASDTHVGVEDYVDIVKMF